MGRGDEIGGERVNKRLLEGIRGKPKCFDSGQQI